MVLALAWLTAVESDALFGLLVLIIGILAAVALSRVVGGPFGTGSPLPTAPAGRSRGFAPGEPCGRVIGASPAP